MGKRSNAARALACAAPRHYHSVRHSRQRCGRIARRMARLASGSPELPCRASAPFAHNPTHTGGVRQAPRRLPFNKRHFRDAVEGKQKGLVRLQWVLKHLAGAVGPALTQRR